MNNPEFVALGTRCTAATILNINNVRKNAFPFDWVDQPIKSILELVQISHGTYHELCIYLNNYFNEVRSQRHPDGSWYPHDFIITDYPEQQLVTIKQKYTRRFWRMFDLFKSGRDIVFLTVLSEYKQEETDAYYALLFYLSQKTNGRMRAISINLLNDERYTLTHSNLVVPFYGDYDRFDADITAALKQNELTKQYFI